MLRASLLVLLTCACAPVLAQNGRATLPGNGTACQDIADKAAETTLPATPDNGRSKAVVVRNKYAAPATPALPNIPATTRGGGDDGDAGTPVLTRPRGPKWHSFLPGMFR